MGPRSKYGEKLLDPRWQKLRLQIFERDKWLCKGCATSTETLHVHHIAYVGADPWDTPPELLITLCAECHAEEGVEYRPQLNEILKLFAYANVRTSMDLMFLEDAVCDAYLRLKDWKAAWLEGLRMYFDGWPGGRGDS